MLCEIDLLYVRKVGVVNKELNVAYSLYVRMRGGMSKYISGNQGS